ncbi:MAG: ABC transporter permease [Lewinellaceae bacterium]|nr:ABC transporter permease [Lewinellaceae bacterium]MCB9290955.1 ABC transporter permease [Lewinellaceae bacterium]
MWKNYFKMAWRQAFKYKGYSLLNILGLAIGITSCLLILQYVAREWSYDTFHPKADNIYRLRLDSYQNGRLAYQSATVFPAFAPTMKEEMPEVVDACRLHDAEMVITNPENNVKFAEKKGYYADPSFLKMFGLELLYGTSAKALDGPDKILLSESMARRYFGQVEVLGRHLINKGQDLFQTYEVSGVFKDYPANSHLAIDYLVSYQTLGKVIRQVWGDTTNATETNWGWYDFYTYLELHPDTDVEQFREQLPSFVDKHINAPRRERGGSNTANAIDIIPLKDIHLYSNVNQEAEVNGSGWAVSVLFASAFFILLIAWVNYVNLATARSLERAREVGLRKVLGAGRRQLIGQFLLESFILNLTAFVLALGLVQLALPLFNSLLGQKLAFTLAGRPQFWAVALAVFAGGTLVAGLYPAFVLSGFRPLTVLRGQLKNASEGMLLRKGLIVFQFAASIALVVGTIVVFQQVRFMRQQNLGVNISQTLVLNGPTTVQDSLYEGRLQPFKNDIMNIPGVKSITASSYVPGDEIYWTNGVQWMRRDGQEALSSTVYTQGVDETFLEAYGLPLVAGRNFAPGRGTEEGSCLLNETAVGLLGFPSAVEAIGEQVRRGGDTLAVIGVTKDFHHLGLQKPIQPIIFLYRPNSRGYYSLRVEPAAGNMQSTIAAVQRQWYTHFPDDPFSYFFLNEFFGRQYQADVLFGKIFGFFALLAILVAALGLFGLSSYNVVQRTKEIGIRKVLGASVSGIVRLLSEDFLKLVGLAILVAIPVAWYVMEEWLQNFAFRISIGWWVFLLAGGLALLIAFLTVSVQSVKAALSDPVKALRYE